MFRKVRKIKNELGLDEAKKLLANNTRGVLSFNGDNEYPYSIPLNYFYDEKENKIYFHGSKSGYKIDCIKRNNKSCFVTYGDEKLSEDGWSYNTSSVVAFGKIQIIEDKDLALEKVIELSKKYYPSMEEVEGAVSRSFKNVLIYCLDIEYMTCKRVNER